MQNLKVGQSVSLSVCAHVCVHICIPTGSPACIQENVKTGNKYRQKHATLTNTIAHISTQTKINIFATKLTLYNDNRADDSKFNTGNGYKEAVGHNHTHTHTRTHPHTPTHTHIHAHTHKQTYINTHVYSFFFIFLYYSFSLLCITTWKPTKNYRAHKRTHEDTITRIFSYFLCISQSLRRSCSASVHQEQLKKNCSAV
jgi:hypothetical protein